MVLSCDGVKLNPKCLLFLFGVLMFDERAHHHFLCTGRAKQLARELELANQRCEELRTEAERSGMAQVEAEAGDITRPPIMPHRRV